MAWPLTPRDLVTEVYVNGGWVDISTDVLERAAVTISRGRRDEASRPEPCNVALHLSNGSGDYSPRNPVGSYFGSFGLNTPMRLALRQAVDTFSRTVSNGWGSNDTGQAWTTGAGAGGTVAASDWDVSPGAGRHSVPAAAAYRLSYLAAASHRDVDVAVTVTLPFTDVTGGDLEPANIVLRGQSASDYYLVRLVITPAEAVNLKLTHIDGTEIAPAVTVPGLTHTAAQALRVRAQAEAHTLRAKVWPASGAEPYDWHVTGHTGQITSAGWVGIRSGVASGNTNTKPIVFSYGNLVISQPRAAVELSDIRPKWDASENDQWTEIVAQGIRRRLGAGSSPLSSTLYRGTTTLPVPALAYWPCEDGTDTLEMSSALGGPPMRVIGPDVGNIDFGAYTDLPASAPLPRITTGCRLEGEVPPYQAPSPNKVMLRFYVHCPDSPELPDLGIIASFLTTGSAGLWEIKYTTGGGLRLQAFDIPFGTLLFDSGPIGFDMKGRRKQFSLCLTQNGSNIDIRQDALEVGASAGSTISDTLNNRTVGNAFLVVVDPFSLMDGLVTGHYSVRPEVTTPFDQFDELNAYAGERAGVRLQRLCAQEGIPFSWIGDLGTTTKMGFQRVGTLLELVDECADADQGTLADPRGEIGLLYRTRTSLYSQSATLDLDYAAGHVAPPFEPSDDDAEVRNDVRVTRAGGATGRAQLLTGRKSVLAPKDGGCGRYDHAVTLSLHTDDQAAALASWIMALSTVSESRYPQVSINLANAETVAAGKDVAALDLHIDDRSTISNPLAKQTPDQISQLARGYVETIRNFVHRIELVTAPESPYRVGKVGGSGARVDAANSALSDGPYSSSATSLTVTTTSPGSPWITGSVSIDLDLAGEVVRVTNISGATSPQTFTVQRSINGVVKGQVNGTRVRLAKPVKIGLGG